MGGRLSSPAKSATLARSGKFSNIEYQSKPSQLLPPFANDLAMEAEVSSTTAMNLSGNGEAPAIELYPAIPASSAR
jgi:hypothetical protein